MGKLAWVSLLLEFEPLAGNVSSANRYEGTHDFRNVCKMDVGNGVLQFERTILSASVEPVAPRQTGGTDHCDIFMFEITGLAFLYHQVQRQSEPTSSSSCFDGALFWQKNTFVSITFQVRCMMALLLLIGQKLEAPEIIDQLLDVESNPRKPQYR